MLTAKDYWVDWVCFRGTQDSGGVVTHAVPNSGGHRAVCGVETGGDGAVLTLEETGEVGCRRCANILEKRGVLPLRSSVLAEATQLGALTAANFEGI